MLKCLERGHPVDGVPVQAKVNKVQKLGVLALLEHVLKRFGVWQATSTSRVGHDNGVEGIFFEEEVAAGAQLDNILGWDSLDFHDVCELLGLILTREEWITCVQLGHNATEGPHVDACCVRDAQDNLRSTVKTTLDIGVNALVLEAATTIVNNFDARLIWLLEKDILRLEIAVDDVVVALKFESLQNLNGEAAN